VNPRSGLDDVEAKNILTLPGLELRALRHPARSQSVYRLPETTLTLFTFYVYFVLIGILLITHLWGQVFPLHESGYVIPHIG
jgi:hypothetical protein